MTIIGTKSCGHDASFCLVGQSGEIVFYCEEERFNRSKHNWHLTHQALRYIIEHYKIDQNTPTLMNYYDNLELFKFEPLANNNGQFPVDPKIVAESINTVKEVLESRRLVKDCYGFTNLKILNDLDHHMTHAASCFFPSPFEEAAILVVDGTGDGFSTLIARGTKNKIEPLFRIPKPHSLGDFYCFITIWLGLGALGDEGKTMGASSYGDPKRFYKLMRDELIDYDDDGVFWVSFNDIKDFERVLGKKEKPGEMTKKDWDVAAACQLITEEIMLGLSRFAKKITGAKNLCLAGGVALNSVANGKILKAAIFDDLWIQPAAGDEGLSIGGALWNYFVTLDHKREMQNGTPSWWVQEHTYWGPEYGDADIEAALDYFKLPKQKTDNAPAWAAKQLGNDRIVGWFQGRIELGPRSLGNRSILANPSHPEMKDIVNRKVKFRDPWRPFAPSVLEEDCGEYFDSDHTSPYMILVYDVLPHWKDKLPAITHVDGTARVQTVSKKTNPRYYKLIEEFKKLTGVAMVLNTSFNLKGEPIVLTPRQAIADFLRSQMDCLVLGDYILDKNSIANFDGDKVAGYAHPLHENLDKLADGHYVLFDFTSTKNDHARCLENLLWAAQHRNITFAIVPIEKTGEEYNELKKQCPQKFDLLPSPKITGTLSFDPKLKVRGTIALMSVTALHLIKGLENHAKQLFETFERLRILYPRSTSHILDQRGVIIDAHEVQSAMDGVAKAAEALLDPKNPPDWEKSLHARWTREIETRRAKFAKS